MGNPSTEAPTAELLNLWIDNANKGDTLTYFTGNLMGDRNMRDKVACSIGNAAWAAYMRGKVLLTQCRVDSGVFAYKLTVTKRAA